MLKRNEHTYMIEVSLRNMQIPPLFSRPSKSTLDKLIEVFVQQVFCFVWWLFGVSLVNVVMLSNTKVTTEY